VRCYLVCYDISDPKRLRRVLRVMKGYGRHWQLSVFFCVLKSLDRVRMQRDLEAEMNQKEDQAVIVDLGPDEEQARQAITVIGPSLPPMQKSVTVI